MPRREPMKGWGARIGQVRARFDLDRRAFARFFEIADTSVRGWEDDDSATSPGVLKRGLVALGVPDVDRTLSWLADGEGPEPYWLNGVPGSPIPPSGPDGLVAMPQRALDVGREAFRILDSARATGTLRDPPALKAWHVLEGEECFAVSASARTSSSARRAA